MSGLPDDVAKWAEDKNIRKSMRGIAERAEVSTSAVSRVLRGKADRETVHKVAKAEPPP